MHNALVRLAVLVGTVIATGRLGFTSNAPVGIPISGTVTYANGPPAAGATVVVAPDCSGVARYFVRTAGRSVVAARNGTFTIDSFDPECSEYILVASFEDQFWLKTADQIFSVHGERIPSRVIVAAGSLPPPAKLLLDERGGRVRFRVWSGESKSFISESLTVCRPLIKRGEHFNYCPGGSLSFGTGAAGDGATFLLPEGSYSLSAPSRDCWDRAFAVTAGSETSIVLTLKPCELQQR